LAVAKPPLLSSSDMRMIAASDSAMRPWTARIMAEWPVSWILSALIDDASSMRPCMRYDIARLKYPNGDSGLISIVFLA
jgi:hypothetical protein